MILRRACPSLPPNAIHFFLQRQPIQRRQRKSEKKTDAPVENKKRVAERPLDFRRVSVHGGRIWNSPMRRHRLSRPQRTGFFGGVVADREHEMQLGSARMSEFVPVLTPQARHGHASRPQLLQSFRTHCPRRMTPSAESGEG